MHQALYIDEILREICAHLSLDLDNRAATAPNSLCCLARTCKALSDPALDAIWECVTSLDVFLSILPSYTSDWMIAEFSVPELSNADWDKFLGYSRRVKRVTLFGSDFNHLTSPVFPAFMLQKPDSIQHPFPCLKTFHFNAFALAPRDAHVFLSCTLEALNIDSPPALGEHATREEDYADMQDLIHAAITTSSSLEGIHVEDAPIFHPSLINILSTLPNLSSASLVLTSDFFADISIALDSLNCLWRMDKLKGLSLACSSAVDPLNESTPREELDGHTVGIHSLCFPFPVTAHLLRLMPTTESIIVRAVRPEPRHYWDALLQSLYPHLTTAFGIAVHSLSLQPDISADVFLDMPPSGENLNSLVLDAPFVFTDEAIASIARACPALVDLIVLGSKSIHPPLVTIASLQVIAKHCTRLQRLSIRIRPQHTSAQFFAVQRATAQGYVHGLRSLVFEDWSHDEAGWAQGVVRIADRLFPLLEICHFWRDDWVGVEQTPTTRMLGEALTKAKSSRLAQQSQ